MKTLTQTLTTTLIQAGFDEADCTPEMLASYMPTLRMHVLAQAKELYGLSSDHLHGLALVLDLDDEEELEAWVSEYFSLQSWDGLMDAFTARFLAGMKDIDTALAS
ncbi:MAG: hypothetical protein NZL83_04670 [Candidatus Absconditabacterales bacterium]|nr:hypothetical protein [Candidatus Absconditabacterales bacterium]